SAGVRRINTRRACGRAHVADAPRGDLWIWRRIGFAGGTTSLWPSSLSQPNHQNDRSLSGRRHNRLPRPSGRRSAQDRTWRQRRRRKQARSRYGARRGAGARSEPDGYTLLMATSTTLAINKTLYKKLPYDPVKDFAPVALVAAVPFALIINPAIPAKTLTEFIAYVKSKPGLAYGSAGNGSPQHLGAEMIKTAAGIEIRHVPYRGSIPAMLDVIAGHIPFMVVDLQPALQQIREGKVRVLGVTTPKRVAAAPEIPTLAEAGLAGFELVAW